MRTLPPSMVRRVAVIHVAALLHMYLRAHEPRRRRSRRSALRAKVHFFCRKPQFLICTTRGSLHSNCREQFSSCLRQCAHQPYGMNYWLAIAKRWNTHDKPGRKDVGGGAAWWGERVAERAHGRQRNVPHAPPAPRLGSRAQGSR